MINIINELIEKGKKISCEKGILHLLKYVLFQYTTFYIYENNLSGPQIYCKVNNLKLKVITCHEELDQILAEGFDLSQYEMDVQQCKQRLSRGVTMFCAFIGKEFAMGTWVGMVSKSHHDFYNFPLHGENTACIGGSLTSPKFRRKGINVYVYSEIFQYLRDKGISSVVFQVYKDNIASQGGLRKLGSYVSNEGHFLRVLYFLKFRWTKPINTDFRQPFRSHK